MSGREEIVTTIDGTEASRSECRLIKGDYYKVGDPSIKNSGQCFQVGGKYYRLSTGYIVFDELKQEYVLKNDSLIEGIVGFDSKGDFVKGYFTKDDLKNVYLSDRMGMTHLVMDESVLSSNREYRYDKSRDRYTHIGIQDAIQFNKLREVSNDYKYSLQYDCREIIGRYTSAYEKSSITPNTEVLREAPYLRGLTFGLEFETVAGMVPDRITRGLGLIPLRDGSINGLEYATIPLSGERGLQAAIESCKALEKFTKFDESCSLHLHMGGIPRTEEYLLALFKVLCLIQDEFFEMFPIYKKYNFGVKRKNYTQPFDAIAMMNQMDKTITSANIKQNFDVLYSFLSRGQSYSEAGNDLKYVQGHPSDPRGTSKWNITSRYYWVNLIPIIFGNKQTVEFRIHTPTTDYNKTLNYIFICGAVLNYVKDEQSNILSGRGTSRLSLSDIIIKVYGKSNRLIDSLLDYMSERKRAVAIDNSKGNIRGSEETIKVKYYDWEATSKKAKKSNSLAGEDAGFSWRDWIDSPVAVIDSTDSTPPHGLSQVEVDSIRRSLGLDPVPTRTRRTTGTIASGGFTSRLAAQMFESAMRTSMDDLLTDTSGATARVSDEIAGIRVEETEDSFNWNVFNSEPSGESN